MSILLDLLMVLLFGVSLVSGWKRGFVKMFGGLLALAAATVVSAWLCEPLASLIIPKSSANPTTVQLICMVALFVVTYALVAFIIRSLDLMAKLPLIKQLNKVMGLVLGAVCGALWVLMTAYALQMLVRVGWIPALTEAVIAKTWIASRVVALLPSIAFVSPIVITR